MKAHPFCLARGNVRDDAKYGGVLIFSGGSEFLAVYSRAF